MILVEITNFQSISHLKFKIDGFTALVGRSNVGKSAIIRAIKCALTGAGGSNFVRHDAATCAMILRGVKKCQCTSKVQLDFGDGRKLLWEKGSGTNQYTIWEPGKEKQIYHRIGQNPDLPSLISDNFSPVQVGDRKRLLQISDQFHPIFLLNLSGTTVADVLSDVAKLDEINVAMRMVSKDRKEAVSTRKVRDQDILGLVKELKGYSGFEATVNQAQKLKKDSESLKGKVHTHQKLEEFQTDLTALAKETRALMLAVKPPLPDSEVLESKSEMFLELAGFQEEWAVKAKTYKSLVGVTKIDVPKDPALQGAFKKFQHSATLVEHLSSLERVLSRFKGFSNLKDLEDISKVQGLFKKFQHLSSLLKRRTSLEKVFDHFKGFSELEDFEQPLRLQELQGKLKATVSFSVRFDSLEASVLSVGKQFEDASTEELEVRSEFQDLGVCYTCSQTISPEHVLCGG